MFAIACVICAYVLSVCNLPYGLTRVPVTDNDLGEDLVARKLFVAFLPGLLI